MRVVEAGEAYEVIEGDHPGRGGVLLTCEHASEALPSPWGWAAEDRWLVGTHWAFDLGAADLTADLADALGTVAVRSRVSRLLCDPNRDEGDPTVFRAVCHGREVALNRGLEAAEREGRLARFHRPYHAAVDRIVKSRPDAMILSIHTFTPSYEDQPREVEVGVLFDEHEELALDLALALHDEGLPVWLNEPWSGKDGLIYSPERHARAHGRQALELEVRQDLSVDPAWRAMAVPKIKAALEACGVLGRHGDAPALRGPD